MKTLAIIGRPNVGKSTIFNRLCGKNKAIVEDTPGVTRDRKFGVANLGGYKFNVIDTAGLEKAENNNLKKLMMEQTELAVNEADAVLFVVDGESGLTTQDQQFAKWLRTKNKPVILLANKCEKKSAEINDFFRLGFGAPVAISAEHKEGWADFADSVAPHVKGKFKEDEKDDSVQIAILGRPNVGKSTIINKILGSNRVIVSDIAGTTRDSIYVDWEYKDKKVKLVDTAGLRKRSHIAEQLEKFSVGDTLYAVRYAHVVALVIDATQPLEHQDLKIADMIINEGRAVILVLNKWDLIKNKAAAKEEIEYLVNKQLGRITGVRMITISAAKDKNIDSVIKAALEAYEIWNKKIPTSALNRWLEEIMQQHSPPIVRGRRLKIRYITQTKSRPPAFRLDVSIPDELPESYLTYLTRSLRESFSLQGTPIRFSTPKKSNPYKDKKKF